MKSNKKFSNFIIVYFINSLFDSKPQFDLTDKYLIGNMASLFTKL